MKEFKEKVALVTGAGSGIGFALADRFASVGMKVVLADIEPSALDSAERSLKAKGAPVLSVRTDVSKPKEVEELANRAYDKFGAVHVLCNNAGVGMGGLSWEQSLEDWQWVMGVNLWGVVHGLREFVPRMIAQGTEGHIVNTASVAGLITSPYLSVYQATKHAVVALTESLRMELELMGTKLSASVLCPGFVATKIDDSERNRPPELQNSRGMSLTSQQAMMREFARQNVSAGLRPAAVADLVVEAIRDDRFYVVTHPRFSKLIRTRMENILEGKPPRYEPPA
jgi:NAD(P)-dependent dehydrogenase (short-subunit alcohol dehydrogenase family)